MAKQYLQLDDVRVYHDEKTGATRIISKDERLKGSSFQLSLLRDTPAGEAIHRLLKDEGLLKSSSSDGLPLSAVLPRRPLSEDRLLDEFFPNSRKTGRADPRMVFLIGETFDGKYLKIDLDNAPMTLIGSHFSEKLGEFNSALQEQILDRSGSLYRFISPERVENEGSSATQGIRSQDRVAQTRFEAFGAIAELEKLLVDRYTIMDAEGANNWSEVETLEPIFVLVDGLEGFFGEGNFDDRGAMFALQGLIRLGRSAGIYSFISTTRPDNNFIPGEMKANMGRRIILGHSDSTMQSQTIGQSVGYPESLFSVEGRGVIRTYGTQVRAFQGFSG